MSYCTLAEDFKFLKKIMVGANKNLSTSERESCEGYADAIIHGKLKNIFSSPYPPLIIEIAELLAASKAYSYLHKGAAPGKSDYSEILKKDADDLFDELLSGKIDLRNADGTKVTITAGPLLGTNKIMSRDIKDNTEIIFRPGLDWEDMEEASEAYDYD